MLRLSVSQERFKFLSEAYDSDAFIVSHFVGSEGISQLYDFSITLVTCLPDISKDAYLDLSDEERKRHICVEMLLNHPAVFVIKHNDVFLNASDLEYDSEKYRSDGATYPSLYASLSGSFKDTRNAFFYGYPVSCSIGEQISQTAANGELVQWTFYTICLRPALYRYSLTTFNIIFTSKSLQSIIKKILSSHSRLVPSFLFDVSGPALFTEQDFSFQYNETCFDYMSAKLEHEGLYYFYSNNSKLETVIVQDDLHKYLKLAGSGTKDFSLAYRPIAGTLNTDNYISSFTEIVSPTPKTLFLRDYNWKNPNTPVEATAEISKNGVGEVYYYGEGFYTDADALRIAKIRAEEIFCHSCYYLGTTDVPSIRAGYCFTLKDHFMDRLNGLEYLVTEISHVGSQDALLSSVLSLPMGDTSVLSYKNTFKSIPSTVQYRPKRVTKRPKVHGLINAFIASVSDDKSTVDPDEFGRYMVTFPHNTELSNSSSVRTSGMVRRISPSVCTKSGTAFPLYPGTEVLISFLDGNPDMPFITNAVNNAETNFTGQAGLGFSNLCGGELSITDNVLRCTQNGAGLIQTSNLSTVCSASTRTKITTAMNTDLATLSNSMITSYSTLLGVDTTTLNLGLKLAGPTFTALGEALSADLGKDSAKEDSHKETEIAGLTADTLGRILPMLATINLRVAAHRGQSSVYGTDISNKKTSSNTAFEANLTGESLSLILASIVAHMACTTTDATFSAIDTTATCAEDSSLETADGIEEITNAISDIDWEIYKLDNLIARTDENSAERLQYEAKKVELESQKAVYQGELDIYYADLEKRIAEKEASEAFKYSKNISMAKAIVPNFMTLCSDALSMAILIYINTMQNRHMRGGVRLHSSEENIVIAAAKEARLVSDRQVLIGANKNLKASITGNIPTLHSVDSPFWGTGNPFRVAENSVENSDHDARVGIIGEHIFSGATKVNRMVSLDEITVNSANKLVISNKSSDNIVTGTEGFLNFPGVQVPQDALDPEDLAQLAQNAQNEAERLAQNAIPAPDYPCSHITMDNSATAPSVFLIEAQASENKKNILNMQDGQTQLSYGEDAKKAELSLEENRAILWYTENNNEVNSCLTFSERDVFIGAGTVNAQIGPDRIILNANNEARATFQLDDRVEIEGSGAFNVRAQDRIDMTGDNSLSLNGGDATVELSNNRGTFLINGNGIVLRRAALELA